MNLSDEFIDSINDLAPGKKIYFASDFHLGAPNKISSEKRERLIIEWLDKIAIDAQAILLVGDVFDFWFEYKYTIPKGYSRFLSKLVELKDKGIQICLFTGNHDMWMFDYFPKEFKIPVFYKPISINIQNKRFYIAHGDGLGPGDHFYKFLKSIFSNKFFQWAFHWLHPNIGMWIANTWSSKSRIANEKKDETFKGEEEWLWIYSHEIESKNHHDYYIYGHRHLPLELEINEQSKYFNLGEWVYHCTYLSFDGNEPILHSYSA